MSPLLIQNLANRLINLREFDRASYLVQKLEEVAPEKTSRIAFTRARLTYANGDTAGAYRLLKDGYENTSVVRNNLATLARFLNNEVEHAQYANSFWTVWFELGRERYDAADVAFANLSQDMREGEAGAYLRYMLHLRRREYSKAYEVLKEEEWDLSEAGDFFQVDVNSLGTPELSLMFRELGNREEAERLLTYTERRIAEARRDGYEFLTHEIDAQVAILRGDKQRAVAQLRQAKSLRYLNWTDKNSLVIRDLKGMLEFEALFDEVVDEVNAVRVELGWEALDREAFYPGKESG